MYRPRFRFTCDICQRQFKQTVVFKRHVANHTKQLMKCTICDYESSNRHNVIRHQVRHTGKKPFQCHNCKHCFTMRCNLTRHQKKCNNQHLLCLLEEHTDIPNTNIQHELQTKTLLEQQLDDSW